MVKNTCSVPGCDYPTRTPSVDLCGAHYERKRKTGSTSPEVPVKRLRTSCAVAGCDRRHESLGYCALHYDRLRKTGDVRAAVPPRIVRAVVRDDAGARWCHVCEQWLAEVEFDKANVCIRCRQVSNFGLNRLQWEAIFEAQGRVCAICSSDSPGGSGWATDHDHSCCPGSRATCGRCVRGILCSRCNTGIGLLHDDPEILIAAAAYVRSYREVKHHGEQPGSAGLHGGPRHSAR
ncbi:hypothetical protein HII28_02135 [Planctomonas sp. JC2975]|nr:hypothetical protein [Planctomonas sp. JC2975]